MSTQKNRNVPSDRSMRVMYVVIIAVGVWATFFGDELDRELLGPAIILFGVSIMCYVNYIIARNKRNEKRRIQEYFNRP